MRSHEDRTAKITVRFMHPAVSSPSSSNWAEPEVQKSERRFYPQGFRRQVLPHSVET